MADELDRKRSQALARYYWKQFRRRSNLLSWLVLFVALYLSLALIAPPLQAPLQLVGLTFPSITRYEVAGIVRESGSLEPVVAARVTVGGYSTTTDGDGRYRLEFSSSSSQDVCIVVQNLGLTTVYFRDAGPDFAIELNVVVK